MSQVFVNEGLALRENRILCGCDRLSNGPAAWQTGTIFQQQNKKKIYIYTTGISEIFTSKVTDCPAEF